MALCRARGPRKSEQVLHHAADETSHLANDAECNPNNADNNSGEGLAVLEAGPSGNDECNDAQDQPNDRCAQNNNQDQSNDPKNIA